MESPDVVVKRTLIPIREELLSTVMRVGHESPKAMAGYIPELDRVLRRCFEALDALRRFLLLAGTARLHKYDVLAWMRSQSAHSIPPIDSLSPLHPEYFQGDVEQMSECLRLVQCNLARLSRKALTTRLFLGGPRSRLEVGFDDEPILLDTITLEPGIQISPSDLAAAWSKATGGGLLAWQTEAVVLFLSGRQPRSPHHPDVDVLLGPVQEAGQRLAPWRGAVGHYEEGLVASNDLVALYAGSMEGALVHIEQVLGTVGV